MPLAKNMGDIMDNLYVFLFLAVFAIVIWGIFSLFEKPKSTKDYYIKYR